MWIDGNPAGKDARGRPSRRGTGYRDERGSSLVEVTVAMVVLTLAIFPVVAMLEAGLGAANAAGRHDAARALANEKIEEAGALPYSRPGGAADSVVERYAPPGPPDAAEGPFSYTVRTQFVEAGLEEPAPLPTGQMRLAVTVRWDGGHHTTRGYVSGDLP